MCPPVLRFVCLTALAGCATTNAVVTAKPAQVPAPAASAPAPLKPATVERELQGLRPHAQQTPDGSIRLTVEASASPSLDTDQGAGALLAPLGDAQLQCFIYPRRFDLGRVVQSALKDLLPNAEDRELTGLRAGQSDGRPYVIVRARYWLRTGQLSLPGDLKLAASAADDASVLCALDAPGLDATFERVLRGMLSSLSVTVDDGLVPAQQREIVRTRRGQRAVGITERIRQPGEGHTVLRTSYQTTLRIAEDGSLVVADSSSVRRSRDGSILQARYVRYVDDEHDRTVHLTRMGDTYIVDGKAHGDVISTRFDVQGGLADSQSQQHMLCDGHGQRLSVYAPEQNPTGATELLVEQADAGHVRVRVGKSHLDATIDDACQVIRGVVEQGGTSTELEQLWISSTLSDAHPRG